MRAMKKYLSIIMLSAILFSCETVVDIDVPFDSRLLVVNAVLDIDSLMKARVSRSMHVLEDPWRANTQIENAQVEISEVSGAGIHPLFHRENGFYFAENNVAESGKTYRIRVSAPNFETLEGITTIPHPVGIRDFSVSDERIKINQSSSEYNEVRFTIDDPAGQDNYYLIQYFSYIPMYRYDHNTGDIIFQGISKERIYPLVQDPLLKQINGADILITDEFFRGNSFNVIAYINANACFWGNCRLPDGSLIEEFVVEVELRSINRDYYLFLSSLDLQMQTSGDPFAEPAPVYSNIENGLGIFAGYSKDTAQFVVKNSE